MDFKTFIFLLFSSTFSLTTSSQDTTIDPGCIKKLIPCQPYLKPQASPPATCCAPLADMIKDDVACLCSIYGDSDLLKQFNITQAEVLDLPKACGAKVNISLCKSGTAAPTPPATPPTTSNSSSPSESSTKENNAFYVAYSGLMLYIEFCFVCLILATM